MVGNLKRAYLREGVLARMVAEGIRGVTANPTIFAKAIQNSADYDEPWSLSCCPTIRSGN